MAKRQLIGWQLEIENILKKDQAKSQEKEALEIYRKLLKLIEHVDKPEGIHGTVINTFLKHLSKNPRRIGIAIGGFQLGVAWERYVHERSSGKS